MDKKMDERAIQYCMQILDEIGRAVEEIGMVLHRADLQDTRGIPSGVITFPDDRSKSWAITCSALVTHVNTVSTGFVQLFLPLTEPLPEKRYQLEMFIEGCAGYFMLGSLGIFDDYLAMKYVLALEPAVDMNTDHFLAALVTFAHQAQVINQQAAGLCSGTLTMEQALDFNAVQ